MGETKPKRISAMSSDDYRQPISVRQPFDHADFYFELK
jgi:hypothetical protein